MKNILFIGSSVVAGKYGIDWISKLPIKNGYIYHNYGINSAQVPGLIDLMNSNRIQVVPIAIVIMIGGNDAINSIPFSSHGGIEYGRLGRKAPTSSKQFGEEMNELLNLLGIKWGNNIPIGVFSVKPISESVHGKLNAIVEAFNEELMSVIDKHSNATYIDMYTPMIDILKTKTPHRDADNIDRVVDIHRIVSVAMLRYLTCGLFSLNSYSDARGFYFFCDGIHFNERAVEIVLKVIDPFMNKI